MASEPDNFSKKRSIVIPSESILSWTWIQLLKTDIGLYSHGLFSLNGLQRLEYLKNNSDFRTPVYFLEKPGLKTMEYFSISPLKCFPGYARPGK